MLSALEGDDDAMLTALLSEPVPNLGRSAELWLDRGAQVQGLYFGEQDTSVLPRRPEGRIADRLAILAPAVIRSEGPMGLEGMMHNVLRNGWDDLIADWVELGFDFRKVKEPGAMWRSCVDFSAQCRPTTVRYLAEGGLTRDFVEFRNERPWPVLVSVAAVCRDPASVPAVAALNLEDVNALASHGATALDEAINRKRPGMTAALRALGGKTAMELAPAAAAASRAARRIGDDLDLVQNDET